MADDGKEGYEEDGEGGLKEEVGGGGDGVGWEERRVIDRGVVRDYPEWDVG